jgi:hypothetical protein
MTSTPSAIRLYKGLSIYRVSNSPNWMVRVWDRKRKKYLVKSSGHSSSILAKEAAQGLAIALLKSEAPVETEYTFKHFAQKLLHKTNIKAEKGDLSRQYVKSMHWAILNADWGLLDYFGEHDVRKLRTFDWQEYLDWLHKKRPDLSPSTRNTLSATFRNVLKIAQDEGCIGDVPQTPRTKLRDNPRPFFRFHPLVPKEEDAYKRLLLGAEEMAKDGAVVRGTHVTTELYDLILFLVHSFVRPISTELYALTHGDIMIADEPRRLILTIKEGKTGYRSSNTMPGAVSVYERICKRSPEHSRSTHLFLPEYANRTTAAKVVQRQFNALLEHAGLGIDPYTKKKHTLYSLRHTAICMRIINSHGKVNIFNLAKNAGTSVDQIERFYAKYLPLSREMALNLQSFGE